MMKQEFDEWLHEKCPWWYLITEEQEEQYFSQWFDECYLGKEQDNDDEMV